MRGWFWLCRSFSKAGQLHTKQQSILLCNAHLWFDIHKIGANEIGLALSCDATEEQPLHATIQFYVKTRSGDKVIPFSPATSVAFGTQSQSEIHQTTLSQQVFTECYLLKEDILSLGVTINPFQAFETTLQGIALYL